MEFLEWKYKDIINEDFFQNKLSPIPTAFESCEAWSWNLRPFILEDLRATLHEALQTDCAIIKRSRVKLLAEYVKFLQESKDDFCRGSISIAVTFDQSEKLDGEDLVGSIAVLIRYFFQRNFILIEFNSLIHYRTSSRFGSNNSNSLLNDNHHVTFIKNFEEKRNCFYCNLYVTEYDYFESLWTNDECDILLLQVPAIPTILAIKHIDSFVPSYFFKDILTATYDPQNGSKLRTRQLKGCFDHLNESQMNAMNRIISPFQSHPAINLIHGPPGYICLLAL